MIYPQEKPKGALNRTLWYTTNQNDRGDCVSIRKTRVTNFEFEI